MFNADVLSLVMPDSTPPTIQCPSDLTGKLYEDITYDIPMVADNSGYTCLLLLEGPPSGKAVLSEDTTVKYAVKDRKMNQTCEFHIKLEGRLKHFFIPDHSVS